MWYLFKKLLFPVALLFTIWGMATAAVMTTKKMLGEYR
jgi:hypothetical protein